jgi:hypothetical protein
MKYRKKPVVIEAIQWDGTFHHSCRIEDELGYMTILRDSTQWVIGTLEGPHIVSKGDFVIRGIIGEFYSCKAEIFEKTYEKVEE